MIDQKTKLTLPEAYRAMYKFLEREYEMTGSDEIVLNTETVISSLLAECPSFAKLADIEEGAYSILGDFAIYLRDGIANNTIHTNDLENAFSFLKKMGASDDLEVQNQLVVGVLEILADTDESIALARKKLDGQALELFDRILAGWGT